MNKELLRNKYKEIRKRIECKEELDDNIFNKIINLEEYKQSNLILTYVSLEEEVDTIKLIEHALKNGKKVAVPKCNEDMIEFHYINTFDDLKKGYFNILEPSVNSLITSFEDSICIVPGIAFDNKNNRIGYGKGYYDRFLENYNGIKIGLCYNKCICDKVDINNNDIKMDLIITA